MAGKGRQPYATFDTLPYGIPNQRLKPPDCLGDLEKQVAELEDVLGQPATWRDPIKAVGTQERHIELKTRLEALYQHWETALEANW